MVSRFVPNDPGTPGYIAAFEDILLRGEEALTQGYSFDIDETIKLTRWAERRSFALRGELADFCWFRLLTSAVEVLRDTASDGISYWYNYTLATLLGDAFALNEAGEQDAPTDLLSTICKEIDAHPDAGLDSELDRERIFCVLGQLLLAAENRLDDRAIGALCDELEARDQRIEDRASPGLVWGLTSFNQLHPQWLQLVAAHFPVEPPTAATMKQRLLSEGSSRTLRSR